MDDRQRRPPFGPGTISNPELELVGCYAWAPAGIAASWQERREGSTIVELNVRWRKGQHLEPDWKVQHGYLVDIKGQPCVRTKLEMYPGPDFVAKSFSDYMVLGMIMTALPALNAVAAVCGAAPGIVTYLDLPLITPSGWV